MIVTFFKQTSKDIGLLLVGVGLLLCVQVLVSQSVGALGNRFPDPSDFSQGQSVRALVAGDNGSSFLLNAPYSSVRIYVPGNLASVPITVHDAGHCDGNGDAGGVTTTFSLAGLLSDEIALDGRGGTAVVTSGCNANDINWNFDLSSTQIISTGRHIGYRVVEFRADRGSGYGWNTFWLSSTLPSCTATLGPACATISYFDLGGYDQFALKSNSGTGDGNFNLRFRANCNSSSGTYNLRYFDADAGQSNQNGQNPVNTNLNGLARNIYELQGQNPGGYQVGNGGSGSGGYLRAPINVGTQYTWQWQNISSSNGIQFNLPFDGFNYVYNCPPPNPGATCLSVNPQNINVGINQPASFTVTVRNSGGAPWNSTFSLRQTYNSSINPNPQTLQRNITGGVIGGVPYSGPGALAPNTSGNFGITVSRSVPGTYTFNFQMQQNNGLLGVACPPLTVNVGNPPINRPECYVRFVVGGVEQGTNTDLYLPYGVHPVTVRGQVGNGTGTSWQTRHFMMGSASGANPIGNQNLGWLTLVNSGVPPSNYTRAFDINHTVGPGDTTFYYQVWVNPGVPTGPWTLAQLDAWKAANPPPAYPPVPPTGPVSQVCQVTAHVDPTPPIYSPVGSASGNCQTISGSLTVLGVPSSGYLRILGSSSGEFGGATRPVNGNFSFSSFSGWSQAIRPDLSYTVELYGYASDGNVRDSSGNLGAPITSFGFGPCLGGCSGSLGLTGSPEPGETITVTNIGMLVNNSASQSFGGMYTMRVTASQVIPGWGPNPRVVGVTIPSGPGTGQALTLGSLNLSFTVATTFNAELVVSSTGRVLWSCTNGPVIPATRPHFKVYGGDISAGGNFNGYSAATGVTACAAGATGGIRAFARVVAGNDKRGSSAEYGVLSLGAIDGGTFAGPSGFFSADVHNRVADYTSFANTTPTWGGSFGGSHCIPNYWYETSGGQDPSTNSTNLGGSYLNTFGGMDGRYYYNGDIRIRGDETIQADQQITIYVEGDVYIENHIYYAQVGDYKDQDRIPYLTVIARGNIYLDNQVNSLAGLYVAQPSRPGGPANKGRFVTCASYSAGGPQVPSDFTSTCDNRVVINGAIVAQRVKLWKLGVETNTLAQLPNNENSSLYGGTNRAMEEINFIPDIVLGRPAFITNEEPIRAIFNAPPIF